MVLPRFTDDGLLPPGDHPLTIEELRQSYLVAGVGVGVQGWDSSRRAELVDNLELFVRQLWLTGVEQIFVNGSFVGEINPLPDLRRIGLSLIALRLAKGLTQRQLAERLGVNEAQMSKGEKNEYAGVSVERAQRIIDALGGSVTVTVSPEPPPTPEWEHPETGAETQRASVR